MKNYVLAAIALTAPFAIVSPASATNLRPYTDAAFAAAQAEGRPILIDVHAPWCPVCAAQGKVIDKATADPKFAKLIVFRIDYDTQKPLWQKFKAQKQSTLIAFHGTRETKRLAYDANADHVNAVLAATLG